jgi:hypothetical protein
MAYRGDSKDDDNVSLSTYIKRGAFGVVYLLQKHSFLKPDVASVCTFNVQLNFILITILPFTFSLPRARLHLLFGHTHIAS